MLRVCLSALIVLAGSLTFAAPTASAAAIFFHWDVDPSGGLFGPTFTLENGSGSGYAGFFVDLHLDDSTVLSSALLTETDLGGGVYGPDPFIAPGAIVQTTADFSGLAITNAYLRWDFGTVLLLDADQNVLLNGLFAEGTSAEVLLTASPVPEPGTLLLLGGGAAAAILRRRRSQSSRS